MKNFPVGVVKKKWLSMLQCAKWILGKVQYFEKLMIDFQTYFIWISKSTQQY